jgi:hypothetical protein
MRRRDKELSITYIRDAVDMLVLAYNYQLDGKKALQPLGCRIGKYSNKAHYGIYADNRTGIQTGARIPGSQHIKSGRFCRVFSLANLPDTEYEAKYLTSLDYLQDNLHFFRRPSFSAHELAGNMQHLMQFVGEWYPANFNRLVQEEGIWD